MNMDEHVPQKQRCYIQKRLFMREREVLQCLQQNHVPSAEVSVVWWGAAMKLMRPTG